MAAATSANNGETADEFLYGQSEQTEQNWTTPAIQRVTRQNNTLPIWRSSETMNLNHLILENINISPYFKNKLGTLKTYHEVIDEIYYSVGHLEPWEKGTHKTAGQTGMCGGVRGVGAGGVVSTPFCILFKLFTLKITRKQLVTMLNHTDSPYIRALGFMYIRFCQPPETFWEWYEPYFDDEEEVDPKAGGGENITMGQLVKNLLTKLDWYGTLFPRIPVPVQKILEQQLRGYNMKKFEDAKRERDAKEAEEKQKMEINNFFRNNDRSSPRKYDDNRGRDRNNDQGGSRKRSRSRSKRSHSRSKHSRRRSGSRSRHRDRRSRSKSPRRSKPTSSDRHEDKKIARSRSKSPDGKKRHRSSRKRDHKKRKHRHHRRHRSHRDRHGSGKDDQSKEKEKKEDSKRPSSSRSKSPNDAESGPERNRSEEKREIVDGPVETVGSTSSSEKSPHDAVSKIDDRSATKDDSSYEKEEGELGDDTN